MSTLPVADNLAHLDWDHEPGCELPLADGNQCGAVPVTHLLRIVRGVPCPECGGIDPAPVCTPCAEECRAGLEDDAGWRCDHGATVWLDVVPLGGAS